MDTEAAAQPFLPKAEPGPGRDGERDSFDDDGAPAGRGRRAPARSWRQRAKWPLIHACLILLYTAAAAYAVSVARRPVPLNDGPLHDLSLGFEPRIYPNLTGNHFWEEPGPRLEAAWDALLDGINIRVSADELAAADQASIALPEGGGHLAWLTMHHNLHCLRHVHKYTYREVYAPNRTQHEEDHMKLHMDHCLEMMRQDTLCRVDTTLKTFEWMPGRDQPVFKIIEPVRTCVAWPAVVDSLRHRRVEDAEVERLSNPGS